MNTCSKELNADKGHLRASTRPRRQPAIYPRRIEFVTVDTVEALDHHVAGAAAGCHFLRDLVDAPLRPVPPAHELSTYLMAGERVGLLAVIWLVCCSGGVQLARD